MIGVCDGVGGWAEVNICSGKFSRFLCKKMGELFDDDPEQSLKEILIDSVKANPHGGSTTACLAKLELDSEQDLFASSKYAKMHTCNLGDSAYMILRPNSGDEILRKLYRSSAQTLEFNYPY